MRLASLLLLVSADASRVTTRVARSPLLSAGAIARPVEARVGQTGVQHRANWRAAPLWDAEAAEEEAWEEEAVAEDDGITVDENGTEWWEDEEGIWWYREEGWEDWAAWED